MRHWFSTASLLLACTILALLGTVWVCASMHLGLARTPGLGNDPETVAMLPPAKGGSLRFAVMGDPEKGLRVYRRLMRQAAALGATFVIITGDVAGRPTKEAFDLFRHEYGNLGAAALPTFAAIGNHDMPRNGDASLFRSYIGPEYFSFIHEGSLFIFIDNNKPASYDECHRYALQEIALHQDAVSHVFMVMHYPIIDYEKRGNLFEFEATSSYMRSILDSERVTALLMGHVHGYARETYKDTLLLVTGGAGGHLYDRKTGFFHMVLIDVTPEGVHDTLVKIEDTSGILERLVDRLRFAMVVELYPALLGRWERTAILLLVAGACLAFGLLARGGMDGSRSVARAGACVVH
jgi:hypothetical protein